MLQPSNRLTLIDAMRPPAGHRFESAMAVTFTLDLRALLAAPAAFALVPTGEVDAEGLAAEAPATEPVELLHAIRTNAGRITVFSQMGEIALPPSRRVFSFLEKSVVPVRAPQGGVVHPKVWVLTYLPVDGIGEPCMRVLSSSRNLTFDGSWDTVLRLDATTGGGGAGLEPIADLFATLRVQAKDRIDPEHGTRVDELCARLRTARFALPKGVDRVTAQVFGLGPSTPAFPVKAERSLVISPFLSDGFFTTVHPAPIGEVISRPESLDGLGPAAKAAIGTAYAFDDGSSFEGAGGTTEASKLDPGRPLRGVHAKVFAFEVGDRAHLFVGSANATHAAFGANVEILVELEGRRDQLGIDCLTDGSTDEIGLRTLFVPHHFGPPEPDPQPGSVDLDGVRRVIGRLAISGEAAQQGAGWSVTYRSSGPIDLPQGATATCWPLSTAGNRLAVHPGDPLDVTFDVSIEGISAFLAFEISDAAQGRVTGFVVPVAMEGMPEDRDHRILRLLIGDADRFLRYLLALLGDDRGEMDLVDIVEASGVEGARKSGGHGLPVLESLLRTLRTDPKKLLSIDPLVRDLDADDALPEGFGDLWSVLREVAETSGGAP